ncbi:hypothetical protein TWF696_001171 [Orbilia brochopaga]|uniref:HMA domain-containing protein n=1 Tax=Orbilia brochopaga TaxID=3140254 RepID=A0AAV9U7W6_9PEZI
MEKQIKGRASTSGQSSRGACAGADCACAGNRTACDENCIRKAAELRCQATCGVQHEQRTPAANKAEACGDGCCTSKKDPSPVLGKEEPCRPSQDSAPFAVQNEPCCGSKPTISLPPKREGCCAPKQNSEDPPEDPKQKDCCALNKETCGASKRDKCRVPKPASCCSPKETSSASKQDACCAPKKGSSHQEQDSCCRPQRGCCSAGEVAAFEKPEDPVTAGNEDSCCASGVGKKSTASLSSSKSSKTVAGACATHLQQAFNEYLIYLQEGKCICRSVLSGLNDCRAQSIQSPLTIKASRVKVPSSCDSDNIGIAPVATGATRKVKTSESRSKEADLENSASRQHVLLNVSGMTCTGCTRKLTNVLNNIDGVSSIEVTFVTGVAEFDLDLSSASLQQVVARIEKETGFKFSQVMSDYQTLDVRVDPALKETVQKQLRDIVESIEKIDKLTYRISYDPMTIGARSLFSLVEGMSLAPPGTDAELANGKRRLLKMAWSTAAAAVLTIPILALNWSDNPVPYSKRSIVSLGLATLVQALAVPEFYAGALKSLIYSRVLEMDMLVVISITAAYVYSVVAFGLTHAGYALETGEFFETSSLLITLVLLGRLMAAIAKVRAVSAVSVRSLQVEKALLVTGPACTIEIDARLLQPGDYFMVPAHTRIVTDGIVHNGRSSVDESMVTGESIPVPKDIGDEVIAGTINGPSFLSIRMTRLPGKNSITDIANMVENALAAKPRIQDLADTVASYFIPVVISIAAAVFAIWIAVAVKARGETGGSAFGIAITYSIAVLAISCPCALGLAVPMVLVIAGGTAARSGVIIKRADAIERGHKVTDVVFDKTGTITKGDLVVVHEQFFSAIQENDVQRLAKSVTKDNQHPVSVAVARYLQPTNLGFANAESFESIPGAGIQCQWRGSTVRAGNPYWLKVENHPEISRLIDEGMTLFCITVDSNPVVAFGLKANIRDEAKTIIARLQSRKIQCHIVSGDSSKAVENVATEVGIPIVNVVSRYSPKQKQQYVKELMSRDRIVLFCGDGTNDAVAVAQADVGVLIGNASDVSKGTADVVLLGGLEGIINLLDISRRSSRRIFFNFASMGYGYHACTQPFDFIVHEYGPHRLNVMSDFAYIALERYLRSSGSRRLVISVSGIPGSGKTTFTNSVVERINRITQLKYGVAIACSVSMDGFHYTREVLDTFPDSYEAHQRRGAPFTFDVAGLHQLILELKRPVSSSTIYAPSFDHALKDPKPGDIAILPSHRIIIVEGNYLCFHPPASLENATLENCPSPLWTEVADLFDEKWITETPLDIASSRLALRHLQAGIVATLEAGFARANGSDRKNAEDILRWRGSFDRKISTFSIQGSSYATTNYLLHVCNIIKIPESPTEQTIYCHLLIAHVVGQKMDPNSRHMDNLQEIRSQLDQFRSDRTRYIKSSDIESIFRSLDVRPQDLQTIGGDFVLPTYKEEKPEAAQALEDILLLLSLAYMTVGKNNEPPAVYSILVVIRILLYHLTTAAVYSRHDLKTLEAKFHDIACILERGKEKYDSMWSDFFESQLDECRRALIPVKRNLDGLSHHLDPLYEKLVSLYRQITAAGSRPKVVQSEIKELQERILEIENSRVDGKFLAPDGTTPEGQEFTKDLLERCRFIANSIADRTLKVDPAFSGIYESLSAIKGKLEQLMLTQAWSMRETDLFEILQQLRQIDSGRVDGQFVGSDNTSPEDGQKYLLYLLRKSYALIYELLYLSEPISESLQPIFNQLSTLKKCLSEVQQSGGVTSARELFPFSINNWHRSTILGRTVNSTSEKKFQKDKGLSMACWRNAMRFAISFAVK